jgi:TRAP-type C4-dicarboxylate transport system permease small subunit
VQFLRKLLDRILTIVFVVSGCLLGLGAVLYTFNSITRLFKYGVPWIEEYCIYTVVLMVFLMQAKLEMNDQQLSISFIADRVKNKPVFRRILSTVRGIVTITVYSILFYVGTAVIQQNLSYGVVSAILEFPMGIYFAAVNLSLALVIVYWIIYLFTKKWDPDEKGGVTDNV